MKKTSFGVAVVALLVFNTASWAFDITGKYIYKEKECEGDMTVTEDEVSMNPHISVSFATVCGKQYATCQSGEEETSVITGTRTITEDKSVLASFAASGKDGTKFDIVFTPNAAKLTITDNGSELCGVSGSFSGKWVKAKPSTKKK